MKTQIAQLKNRWQHYSPRERNLFKLCGGALCCAMVYYGAMMPLDTLIKNNEAVLFKQKQTLNWMRQEIDKKPSPVQNRQYPEPAQRGGRKCQSRARRVDKRASGRAVADL